METKCISWSIKDSKTGELMEMKGFHPPVSLQEAYDSLPEYINGVCTLSCVFNTDRPTEGTDAAMVRAERLYATFALEGGSDGVHVRGSSMSELRDRPGYV